jgi:hypothetical protein
VRITRSGAEDEGVKTSVAVLLALVVGLTAGVAAAAGQSPADPTIPKNRPQTHRR